jgi:DNA-binding response OmpR family regulator
MSGYADDAIEDDGTVRPGTDFIQKPFTAAMLAAKVRDVLDRGPATLVA